MKVPSLKCSGPPLGDIATFVWHKESTAPQKNFNAARINEALTGLDGVEVIADDI